jgi:hypothetical protein
MVAPPKSSIDENINPARDSLISAANKRQMTPAPIATLSGHLSPARPALGLRSENIPLPSLLDSSINENNPQTTSEVSALIEDPHFVLGISKGAREAEYVKFPCRNT